MSEKIGTDGKLHPNWGTVVALGIAMTTQSAAALWWASSIDQKVEDVTEWQAKQDGRLDKLETLVQLQAQSSSVLSTQVATVNRDLAKIEAAIVVNSGLLRDLITSVAEQRGRDQPDDRPAP